jgi:ABC-type transport system involved in multi-copper enzyme maturation permease subunit
MLSIGGPVFAKEMVEMARRKRYFFNRVFYGLVLLFTLFVVFQNYSHRNGPGGGYPIRVMAQFADELFIAVSCVQYGAVYLFIPLFVCGVIASEREERTLELLFTTQLQDREIVLGKLLSRLAALLFLILSTLPVMSMIMLFGGIDPPSLWRMMAATTLAILCCGGMAIYFSTITKSPMGALVRTYWWLALWLLGIPLALMIPTALATRLAGGPWPMIMVLGGLLFVNPLGPLIVALNAEAYRGLTLYLGGSWFYPFTFIAPALLSLVLIWRAIVRLRLDPTAFRLMIDRLGIVRRFRQWRTGRHEARQTRRRRHADRILLGLRVRNPLWLRARRAMVYDREGHIGKIQLGGWAVAGFFILVFIVGRPQTLGEHGVGIPFLVTTWIGITALTAIFAATSLVGDRRRGFLELVLTTPLSAREIVDGTILAIWQHIRPLFLLACALYALFCLTGSIHPLGVVCSLLTASLFCMLLAIHGTACSLAARSLPGALVATFAFPLLVNIGFAFMIGIFEKASGLALWVLSVILILVSRPWVRRSHSAAAVGTFLISMHLVIGSIITAWTWGAITHREEFPIAAMHPGFLSMIVLADQPRRWLDGLPEWPFIFFTYWAILAVNIFLARRWLVLNFDRLAERTLPQTQPSKAIANGAGPAAALEAAVREV